MADKTSPATIFCTFCGTENSAGQPTCRNCNNALQTSSLKIEDSVEAGIPTVVMPSANASPEENLRQLLELEAEAIATAQANHAARNAAQTAQLSGQTAPLVSLGPENKTPPAKPAGVQATIPPPPVMQPKAPQPVAAQPKAPQPVAPVAAQPKAPQPIAAAQPKAPQPVAPIAAPIVRPTLTPTKPAVAENKAATPPPSPVIATPPAPTPSVENKPFPQPPKSAPIAVSSSEDNTPVPADSAPTSPQLGLLARIMKAFREFINTILGKK